MAAGTSYLAEYGPRLLDRGYPIIPITKGLKRPKGLTKWQQIVADQSALDSWLHGSFSNGGVGVLTKHFPAIDLDVRDSDIIDKLIDWCFENIGPTLCRRGLAPKTLLPCRTDRPFPKIASKKYIDFLGVEHKVEILGDGQQYVAYAIHPDTGEPYNWITDDGLADIDPDELPVISPDQARELIAYFESIVPDEWQRVDETESEPRQDAPDLPDDERVLAHAKPKLDIPTRKLEEALSFLDADMRMHDWVRVGMALYHQFDGDEEGFVLWDNWSSGGVKYDEKEMAARWRSFAADLKSTNPVTAATILEQARAAGWGEIKQPAVGSKHFRLIHASEVLAKLGPINWCVKHFLEANTTGLMFGDPGAYKSFLALDLAFHVAAGRPWHGNDVTPGPVIYVAGEGHGGLSRRFAAWERHHGVKLRDLPLYVSEQAAQLYNADSAKRVAAAVSRLAEQTGTPALIVVDTLARNFGPGDENSSTDIGLFLNHVDGLLRARFNATILIVHHTGHSHKERARGAMALKAGIDFEYRVEKAPVGMMTRMVCTKMKDAPEPGDVWFEGQEIVVGSMDDDDFTSLVFEPCAAPVIEEEKPLRGKQAALFELIAREIPATRDTLRDIAIDEGLFDTANGFRRALNELKRKDFVTEEDGQIGIMDDFIGAHSAPVKAIKTPEMAGQNGFDRLDGEMELNQ